MEVVPISGQDTAALRQRCVWDVAIKQAEEVCAVGTGEDSESFGF
jgi:hypothetical protein